METDKENQQLQLLGRKNSTAEKAGAPRTPFSAVNRQSAYMSSVSSCSQKLNKALIKPEGKRHSWANEYPIKSAKELGHQSTHASLTPVRTKSVREKSLRKQILEMRGAGQVTKEEQHIHLSQHLHLGQVGGPALCCILPPSPILRLPGGQCLPAGSLSCPEVFTSTSGAEVSRDASRAASLTSSSVPAENTESVNAASKAGERRLSDTLAAEFQEPPLEAVHVCGEASTESQRCGASGKFLDSVATEFIISAEGSKNQITPVSQVVCAKVVCEERGAGETAGSADGTQTQPLDPQVQEMHAAVRVILEELLTDIFSEIHQAPLSSVPEHFEELQDCHSDASSQDESFETAASISENDLCAAGTGQPSSFMAEYSRFVTSYISESQRMASQLMSKTLCDPTEDQNQMEHTFLSASSGSGETDMTTSSFVSVEDMDQVMVSDTRVVLDSLASFLCDAEESESNLEKEAEGVMSTDGEMAESDRFDDSIGFVRSSVSRFDLTKECEESPSLWKSQNEDSDLNDSLNLSIMNQRVVYFASPSPGADVNELSIPPTTPVETLENDLGSSGFVAEPVVCECDDEKCSEEKKTVDSSFLALAPERTSIALSPMPVSTHEKEIETDHFQTSDADTMTQTVVHSIALSPLTVSVRERGVTTDSIEVANANTMTLSVDMSSVALSPVPVPHCEQQTGTDATETQDADTMTFLVQTSEIALSPVAVAVRDMDTMTASPVKMTETAIATEIVECQDHSMLAMVEMLHKTTMTDDSGRQNAHTTMTPMKALAKQGRRLTSDDIRKQHPRTLANQLETLTLCNTRLETDLKAVQQEQAQLKTALKHARSAEARVRQEVTEAGLEKEKQWAEKEHKYQTQIGELEQQVAQSRECAGTLELEVSELRQALGEASRRHAQDVTDLEARCGAAEEQQQQAEQQYEAELQDLKKAQEVNTCRRQFELAQQVVREREAELSELRAVFADLKDSAQRQEQVNAAFQGIHDKVLAVGRENAELKKTLHKQRGLWQEERAGQQSQVSALEEQKEELVQEAARLRHTMELNNVNLSELEKLYSGASTDLLTATGQVLQLNSELFGARKAMQELLLSKEGLARRAGDLQEDLEAVQEERAALAQTLAQAQTQLQKQTKVCEDLRKLNTQAKHEYAEKMENMELGIENLQKTLDNREADIDDLEKDLYECRNIIVQQRYKIDGLESELRQRREEAASRQSKEEDVQFFKESNALLEAERSLYVDCLRDLEEKLGKASLDVSCQQQAAAVAQGLADQLQDQKNKLQSELTHAQTQLSQTLHALAMSEAEQARAESAALSAAGELLQKMKTMLGTLRKKVGMQEVPEASAPPAYQRPRLQVTSAKHKRNTGKSFVSKILAAASTSSPVKEGGTDGVLAGVDVDCVQRNPSEADNKHNTSDMVAVMNGSGDATGTGAGLFAVLDSLSPDKASAGQERREVDQSSRKDNLSFRGLGLNASDLAMAYSLTREDGDSSELASARKMRPADWDLSSVSSRSQPPSAFSGPAVRLLAPSRASAFTAIPRSSRSSSFLSHSLPPPPPPPPTSDVAKIRTLPRTDRGPASVCWAARERGLNQDEGADVLPVKECGFLTCLLSLEEVFADIARLVSILDRATQLSLQDLREENDMLRERTEILEEHVDRSRAEIELSRHHVGAMESTISQLQERNDQMAEQMMTVGNHKFEVQRLCREVKSLEGEVENQRREKEIVATELETLLRRTEASGGAGAGHARFVRDVIALKKKNQTLLLQLDDQKEHYEELGNKAARRMRVLEENWKKAEDEVYRFDELVENIRRIAESHKGSPMSSMLKILKLIHGGVSSPV